jgi:cytochrome c oxidase assembly protein subunit 15
VRLPPVSPERFRRITGLVLWGLGFIIVTGALVRLTGSGLGCSEWPTCEQGRVVAPLETHSMIEFGNRLVTGLIAVPIGLAVLASLARVPRRRDLIWLSLGLVAGLVPEAVLGGISVKVELAPGFISAHFLLSMVLLWNAVVLHHRAGTAAADPVPVVDATAVRLGRTIVGLAAAVLVAGTVVTGTGPHAGDERARRYDFATITDVARFHSLVAWAFLLVTVYALWRLVRAGAPAGVDARGRQLVGATLFQGALGYAQYVAGVPPYLVIVHVLGSVLVFVAALRFHLSLFARPEQPGAGAHDAGTVPATAPLATA